MEHYSDFEISWLLSCNSSNGTPYLIDHQNKKEALGEACLGLCRLPGKNDSSQLEAEVKMMKEEGLTAVLCLLSEKDALNKGIKLEDYKKFCKSEKIEFINHPVQSCKAPKEAPEELDETLIGPIVDKIINQNGKITIHCVNGIGRAGTIAGAILLKMGLFDDSKSCIEYLRERRKKKCVPDEAQKNYLKKFLKYLS